MTAQSFIIQNSNNPEAFNNRANVKCILKDYRNAIADCDSALALKSNYPEAYYNKASALFALGNFNNALALANQAISIAPNFADPYVLKVKILNFHRQESKISTYCFIFFLYFFTEMKI